MAGLLDTLDDLALLIARAEKSVTRLKYAQRQLSKG